MKTIIMLWCKAMIGRIVIKLLLRTVTKIVKTEKKTHTTNTPFKTKKIYNITNKTIEWFS